MARRRYSQLGLDLEEISEKLPPVHPGVPIRDDGSTEAMLKLGRELSEAGQAKDQNDESATEDGGATGRQ